MPSAFLSYANISGAQREKRDCRVNNSGIISQYGFLFQRGAFVLYLLENMHAKQRFCFEGKDDIEIATDDKIYEINSESSSCIQVKSGIVDKECFNKVLGNWLLLDNLESNSYTLFIENELLFEWNESDIVDSMLCYVKDGKDKKKTAISRKVYEQYKDDVENDECKRLKENLKDLLGKINLDICSMERLDSRVETTFFTNHCQDIVEYDLAKKKRLEKFIEYINRDIDLAIKEKKTYSLIFPDLMKIITTVCDEISDHSYKVDVTLLKNNLIKKAKEVVEQRKDREVRQLYLVNSKDEFVIRGIVDELFYKDFRDVFIERKNIDISNLETFAKDNYEYASYEIDENASPKELYDKTMEKPLVSEILPEGNMYRNGCYIYLTGENINEEKQITWGEESETERGN